jgi:hypothetical protein
LATNTVPYKAAMNANVDVARGIVTVHCPYCLVGPKADRVNGLVNEVDVTRFVEHEGKRDHKTSCSKGHVLRFKNIPQWRDERGDNR